MPFIIPFIPAIIGATGAIAGGALAGRGKKSGSGNLQDEMMKMMQEEEKKKMGLIDENEPFLNFFSGDPTKSPLNAAFKTSDYEGTASAYDQAVSNMKATANERGFGYQSPVEQGGEGEIRSEEASQLGKVPGRALLQTIGPSMQAAGVRAGEAGDMHPEAFGGNLTDLEKARQARSASLWSSIMQVGSQLGGAAIDKWGNNSSNDSTGDATNTGF